MSYHIVRRQTHVFVLLALLVPSLVLFFSQHYAVTASEQTTPTGLEAADWRAIQALLPPTQQAYLKASNTDAGDQFGYRIAVSGNTVVVGAPSESSKATGVNSDQTNNSAPNAGAAYVFVREGTIWSQNAYLKASNTDVGDGFGSSVAISGDMVVVGARGESSNATGVNSDQTNNSAPKIVVGKCSSSTQRPGTKARPSCVRPPAAWPGGRRGPAPAAPERPGAPPRPAASS